RLAAEHARGSGRLVLELVPGADVAAPDLVLQDHLPLCGVVRYRDGTPVVGLSVRAAVMALAAGYVPELMRLRHSPPTVRTGSEGRFAFEALPCGRYRIELPVEATGPQ